MRPSRVHRTALAGTASLFAAALLLYGCGEDVRPTSPIHEHGPSLRTVRVKPQFVDLSYVCGNTFRVDNRNAISFRVTWDVANTSPLEKGELLLPARSGDGAAYSTVTFTTQNRGTVRLYYGGKQIESQTNAGTACPPPPPPPPPPSANPGKWGSLFSWPVIGLHLNLLPTGKVLTWGHYNAPRVWDPATGAFTSLSSPALLFCAGHAFLPDGRLLVTGGHISDGLGLRDATLFNPFTQVWSKGSPMYVGRWYPTSTTLANGEVLTIAGTDESGNEARVPEVYTTAGGWRRLSSISVALPYYPRTFLAPNGQVFYAGELQGTRYIDPTGTGVWGPVIANRRVADRRYGSAVMYEPGKILYVGGGDPPTATAEIINLNSGTPTWTATGSMGVARRHHTATVLADGKVLVAGGTNGVGFNNEAAAVYTAELWDPATGAWRTLAATAAGVPRAYHSASILLPSGRVLLTGNGDAGSSTNQLSAQVFTPPYMLDGTGTLLPRPSISSAPTSIAYGQSFLVGTASASSIAKVTLVRLGTATHAFDQNQRFNRLTFSVVSGGVQVTAPASRNAAPPGHYMLFILNTAGTPSVAKIVRLG